jgi:hypothetical protein
LLEQNIGFEALYAFRTAQLCSVLTGVCRQITPFFKAGSEYALGYCRN